MKKLTRIKLINWHYFTNETINLSGSCLISGENATGKSTILDAVQLILTTNTRHFNPAANERSRRDLKGYVRCKTGEEGNTYIRKNSVISYVALEFYEESRDRFFVLGAKFDSPDEDSEIKRVWFCEEGSLDAFNFIVGNKPATDEQFNVNGKKIYPIRSSKEARDRFKRRLGNLDETFFEMIPKSLAFKPMENVKKFITQFILPERKIEVDVLRENIRSLRDMQKLMEELRQCIGQLEKILQKNDELTEYKRDILIIDILMKIAKREDIKANTERNRSRQEYCRNELKSKQLENRQLTDRLSSAEDSLRAIQIDISGNESGRHIDKLEQEQKWLENETIRVESEFAELHSQLKKVADALKYLSEFEQNGLTYTVTQPELNGIPNTAKPSEVNAPSNIPEQSNAYERLNALAVRELEKPSLPQDERDRRFVLLNSLFKSANTSLNARRAEENQRLTALREQRKALENKIAELRKNRLTFPVNTTKLRSKIAEEFEKRSIDSEVRVFADLVEIDLPEWQDAVEGYLAAQRFNIIVEPRYYDIAADVYNRVKSQIGGVILVNTQPLELDAPAPENTLAVAVKSKNRYARALLNYLLGRVRLCDSVSELKQHSIAITRECMLYQGHGLRKIPAEIYRVPYIGKYALKRQLELAEEDYSRLKVDYAAIEAALKSTETALASISECNLGFVERYLDSPTELEEIKARKRQVMLELDEARKDPNIIALQLKESECAELVNQLKIKKDELTKSVSKLEYEIDSINNRQTELQNQLVEVEAQITELGQDDVAAQDAAEQKYSEHRKSKQPGTIYDNFSPRRKTLENKANAARDELITLQSNYKQNELGTGPEVISAYLDEYNTLKIHDLVEYEEKLRRAKDNCELEFRENFLARMRENIESAEDIFKNLNRSLKNIYYGNDSYKFNYRANNSKRGLYDMITHEMNLDGFTLFSSAFENDYHEEMDTLFSKLTESDDTGDNILNEYTDYREYLDYDIEIVNKSGKSQFFSKIYGEKSGGETQTPYYVAIAASFSQIYSVGETIRIIMLDEAFDKMDDERIASMMSFFKSLGFQVILATPPAKIETIGEYVDTILMIYRNGYMSFIENYEQI